MVKTVFTNGFPNERMNEILMSSSSVAVTYARGFEGCGASGILITDDWLISHGSLLNNTVTSAAPGLRAFLDRLETNQFTVLPEETQDYLRLRVFQQRYEGEKSHNGNSSKALESMKLVESDGFIAIAWKCPHLENTFKDLFYNWKFDKSDKIDRSLLPIFLMISLSKCLPKNRVKSARKALTEFFNKSSLGMEIPSRAYFIEISSTPFGNPVFIDSISRGIVSNVVGDGGCVIITDANAVPGSEGAPVYVIGKDGKRRSICGMVIAPLSWCRGEWVDYTFVANLLPCLEKLLFESTSIQSMQEKKQRRMLFSNVADQSDKRIADILDESLVLVRCGSGWGTGIILDVRTGTIVTCSHVVHKAPETRIKVVLRRGDDSSSSGTFKESSTWAQLVYRTATGKAYDVAVLRIDPRQIEHTLRSISIDDTRTPLRRGETVGSAGFPFFSSRYPTITRGNVSSISNCMLQTTCSIQSGSSGGPIVRWSTGEMVGLVVCNAISTSNNHRLYPRLNMAVPISVLKAPLDDYLRTGEIKALQILDADDVDVRLAWNFQSLPAAKI